MTGRKRLPRRDQNRDQVRRQPRRHAVPLGLADDVRVWKEHAPVETKRPYDGKHELKLGKRL